MHALGLSALLMGKRYRTELSLFMLTQCVGNNKITTLNPDNESRIGMDSVVVFRLGDTNARII